MPSKIETSRILRSKVKVMPCSISPGGRYSLVAVTEMPRVSIGITTWNRKHLILRAIESVKRQTYPNVEIVVVDDGSTDGTAFPDGVKAIFHDRNMGIAAAKNRALRECSGELRGLLDSDDVYHPTFVARCVEELQAHPEVGLVYTDNFISKNGDLVTVNRAIDWDLQELLRTCNMRGDCWLARWSVLKQTALHDERMQLEVDYDLFYSLARITTFRHIPEVLQTVMAHHDSESRWDRNQTAYWHAACLGKHGHSIDHAYARALRGRSLSEWRESINAGYEFGKTLK
jgi:glycosyltransferase involved in cell wall biosynthesis